MDTAVLNPTQMHLLKLFAFNNSEDYAREIQMVLMRYFQQKLDEESDRLWEEGVLNQEKFPIIIHFNPLSIDVAAIVLKPFSIKPVGMKNEHPIWTKLNLVENDKSKDSKTTSETRCSSFAATRKSSCGIKDFIFL